jgi:hypothetical protein
MENRRRFQGLAYPSGMSAFPLPLGGQRFFPGGDGLWRDDGKLDQNSDGMIPVGGIMFMGNDFGTLRSFLKLQKSGFENPSTWRNLKQRVRLAGIPHQAIFATNAVMGLRSE